MPKLKIRENEQRDLFLAGAISNNMIVKRLDRPQMAKKVLVSISTFNRRLRMPETFTLAELRRVCKVLDLSDEQIIRAIKGDGRR